MEEDCKNSILIVDDEKVNLKILSYILGADYKIYTAQSGTSAIEKAREYRPDLILLDIIMPGKDGYETLCEMKQCEILQNTPIIFITGLNSEEEEEKGLALNAADYIAKPFSSTIVKLRVQHQIKIINQFRTIELLSLTDSLTQLPNRRCFDERFKLEWKLAIREKNPISILMLDLDNFKNINDTYGHQVGDIVLQKIAEVFPKMVKRPCDLSARWGGEEFIIMLVNTPKEGALHVSENIRDAVEKLEFILENKEKINITVSIGVNSLFPKVGCCEQEFFGGADKALYKAKAAGRNKVVCFSP